MKRKTKARASARKKRGKVRSRAKRKVVPRKRAGRKTAGKKKSTRRAARPGAKTKARKKAPPHDGSPGVNVTPELRRRALSLLDGLRGAYPDARCELDFTNALEALVATILAAQCTDARVNMVTPDLFRKYRTPQDYLDTPDEVLQDEIRSTGFFNNKTRAIKKACRMLVDDFDGRMPDSMEDLVKLPGVGRKTANVMLANIYNVPGVVVDTHMLRLSNRMGFSTSDSAEQVERDMMAVFPESTWISLSHLIPWHGRRCCTARHPMCDQCPVADDCPQLID